MGAHIVTIFNCTVLGVSIGLSVSMEEVAQWYADCSRKKHFKIFQVQYKHTPVHRK